MADTAQIFDIRTTATTQVEQDHSQLMDIGVDEATEQRIRQECIHAYIEMQLPADGPPRHPEFEMFLREHARGRGLFPTIDRSHVLRLIFDVEDEGAESWQLVDSFADDLVRFLRLPAGALRRTEVRRFTDDDATRVLHGSVDTHE